MNDDTGLAARKPIPRRLRFEILRRDGHTCRYCGAAAPDAKLTVDHVVPLALGGTDDPTNLVTACAECNSGKASTSPDETIVADVDETAAKFALAMKLVAAQRAAKATESDGLVEWFQERWYHHLDECGYYRDNLPGDFAAAVNAWFGRGLTKSDIDRFLAIAFLKKAGRVDTFRYLAGCCNREINTRQDLARQMVANGEVSL